MKEIRGREESKVNHMKVLHFALNLDNLVELIEKED